MSDALQVLKSVSKPKLRKGMSYVLKTMHLDAALVVAGLNPHVDLNYWHPYAGGSILQAYYWLPNDRIDHDRVYVRAGCVQSELRRAAADELAVEGLPRFIAWVRTLIALPANSVIRQQKPFFDATYGADGLSVHHTPTQLIN